MLLHLSLVIEILSIIVCIHCIYGEKVKLDLLTVVSFLLILIWLEIVNYYDLNDLYTCVSYVLFGIYTKKRFGKNMLCTIVNVCLFFVVLLILQFFGLVFAAILCPESVEGHSVIGAMITFLACVLFLPKLKLYRLSKMMEKRSKVVLGIIGFVLFFVIIMNLQNKIIFGVQVEMYLLMIPMVVGVLVLGYKWCFSQVKVEQNESMKESYEELLQSVRLKQHGFKNQLSAMLSVQSTINSNEKTATTQKWYYEQIIKENKYQKLLFLGEPIIAGFLYEKFKQAESDGITVDYDIKAELRNYCMPTYYVVEILGILLDNAVEAQNETMECKVMMVQLIEEDTEYVFCVSNPSDYIPYSELAEWFQNGKSSKAKGRGIGLYHAKCICQQFGCAIGCMNQEIKETNYIKFMVRIGKTKADNES